MQKLRKDYRRRQRQRHWSYIDLWKAVCFEQDFPSELDQVRNVEREGGKKAPLDPEFLAAVCRALEASNVRSALISHASRGEGAITLLLQKLGVLDTHLATCREYADQAVRGLITEAEYEESIEALAEIIALDLVKSFHKMGQGDIDGAGD